MTTCDPVPTTRPGDSPPFQPGKRFFGTLAETKSAQTISHRLIYGSRVQSRSNNRSTVAHLRSTRVNQCARLAPRHQNVHLDEKLCLASDSTARREISPSNPTLAKLRRFIVSISLNSFRLSVWQRRAGVVQRFLNIINKPVFLPL